MNALRLMNVLALLLILLPWRAQAAEADDFVAASRSQQAQLLTPVGGSAAGGSSAAAAGVDHREAWLWTTEKHAFRTRQGADYSHWALPPRRRAKPDRSV
ncbi:hypothetical protein LNP17_15190 [Klebsiella variicola subsp. variicola]|nr:hypothetical protein [Klebsiella variicola subsp. variicola]